MMKNRNFYVAEKRIVSENIKDIDSKFWLPKLKTLIKDFVNISRPYLLYYLRNKLSKNVTVGLPYKKSKCGWKEFWIHKPINQNKQVNIGNLLVRIRFTLIHTLSKLNLLLYKEVILKFKLNVTVSFSIQLTDV